MLARYSTIARLCGVLLLLLAVSPVTAPFSAWDPGVLYHDAKTQHGSMSQVKGATDDPVIAPDGRFELPPCVARAAGVVDAARGLVHARALLDRPLRV